jgi:hypothetical protein
MAIQLRPLQERLKFKHEKAANASGQSFLLKAAYYTVKSLMSG